jgi:predicted transposase YdaD
MVIESWSADQAEDTTMETTFTLTFKQMRFIQTITNKGKLLGRAAAQASETENKATQTGGSAALNLGKTVGVITP